MASDSPNVLLTGASGFLGSVLLPMLSQSYRTVGTAHSRACPGLVACDLTDRQAVFDLLDRVRPGAVVHVAALTDVDACERQPDRAHLVNVEATGHIVDWALARRPELRFVHISTDQVYDGAGPHPEADAQPGNVYARTKLQAEERARKLPRAAVLRTNFFGFSATGADGLVDALRNRALAGQPMTLFADVFFSPLFIGHLAEVVVAMLANDVRGVFNAGASGVGLSKAQFARLVLHGLRLPTATFRDGSVEEVPLVAYRPRDMRLDSARLEGALDRQLPSVEDGIRCLIRAWYSRTSEHHQ